jgi:hypothetical protein
MSRARPTFRKRDVTAAVQALKAAGVDVQRVEIDKDGTIKIISADKTHCQSNGNAWDEATKRLTR